MSYKEKKNEIIIAEIQYWKQTKLLPATYCDFLLALYTEGDGSAHQIHKETEANIKQWGMLLLLLVIVPIVLFFSINHSFVQIVALLLLGSLGFVLNKLLSGSKNIVSHLALVVFLLIILLLTISLSKYFFGFQMMTNGVILLNFISWLLFSLRKNYTYLTILSVLASLFLIIYVVYI